MLFRNWIELGIAIAVFIAGAAAKYIIRKKCKRLEGFIGVNNYGPGRGWKLR